ncbi:MAG: CotH kinase family protein, partial [Candidatus Beckwithbacteria bacterium]
TLFKEKDSTDNWNKSIFKDVQDWRAYPDNPDNPDNPDYQALEKLLLTLNTSESTSEDLLNLIDLDNFLSWQVHSILMASIHQDKSHNNNLFYNHQLNKFQFIPWDTGQRDMISIKLNKLYHPIVDFLLSDPTIIKKRDKLLTDYLLNSTYYQQDIDLFNQSINQIYIPLIQDKQKFYPNIKYIIDIKNYRNWINNYSTILKSQLDSDEKY